MGVASSAGTHHAGQDQAPAALRAAGFLDRLRAEGVMVEDRGDLLHEVFVADEMASTARNLATVVRVAGRWLMLSPARLPTGHCL